MPLQICQAVNKKVLKKVAGIEEALRNLDSLWLEGCKVVFWL